MQMTAALLLGTLCLAGPGMISHAYMVADFEDVPLPPGGIYNGSDFGGDFTSGGVTLGNAFDNTYGDYWTGFAVSNVNDPTTPGFGNQYASASGTGHGDTGSYGVAYEDGYGPQKDIITLPAPAQVAGMFLNNTTYAALSMRDGDGFAKQFGGPTGNDPDYLLVTLTGQDAIGQTTGTIDFYLADYRFANRGQDYIVTDWTWVDTRNLGSDVASVHFAFSSSDVGQFGINSPTYFAIDNITILPEPGTAALLLLGAACVLARCRTTK